MKYLKSDTLAARTLAVLILGLALSHTISIAMYATDRTSLLISIDGRHIGDRIAALDRLIRLSSKKEQRRLVGFANDKAFKVSLASKSIVGANTQPVRQIGKLRSILLAHLDRDDNRKIGLQYLDEKSAKTILVSLSMPDKNWLNFTVPLQSTEPFLSLRFGLSMLVMLIAIAIFSAIVVKQLIRPLAEFTHAAQRLGVDVDAPPLPEHGPAEIRQVTHAFNQMQNRIQLFVKDRTKMIAAISHDLGTPIARMRLRAEFVDNKEQQRKMLADLEEMEKMVFSALSFAKDDSKREPVENVDLRTLIQRVCDDLGDTGYDVSVDIDDEIIPYDCRPTALRRALSNLVENAARYGRVADVSVARNADAIAIIIDDDGPGIPQDRLEDVFKPFYRLESSRNRETGGTGLGMTVARTIVRAHGGDIRLNNRAEDGLRVEVHLPTYSLQE